MSLVALATMPLDSQAPASATLHGSIRDQSGAPVGFALITVASVRGVADSSGRFLLTNLTPGATDILVRRLGYSPQRVSLTLLEGRADSLLVVLTEIPFELAGISTEAATLGRMAEFNRHRVNGQGIYLDRQDLEKRRTPRLSDVLRRVPGVRIVSDRAGRAMLRMGRSTSGRDCPPEFWIDGVRAQFLGVDDVPVSDIEALEVYRGPSGMPPEFNSRFTNAQCGAVIIWTRIPG
jgi:outer membrane receptor protein involved in Fe transport